ncbi:MAG: hypothetical protein JXA57_20700 [Armatimonadetes bacterium]|nr:hypothetical protein [Armatimonadota bacterium]
MSFNIVPLIRRRQNMRVRGKQQFVFTLQPGVVVEGALRAAGRMHCRTIVAFCLLFLLAQGVADGESYADKQLVDVLIYRPSEVSQLAALDSVCHYARTPDSGRWDSCPDFVRDAALRTDLGPKVRAKAIRHLHRQPGDRTQRVLLQALASGEPDVVGAVGTVASMWAREGVSVPSSLAAALATYCEVHPKRAFELPGLLKGIAVLAGPGRSRTCADALGKLWKRAKTTKQRDLLLASAGRWLGTPLLARSINDLEKRPTTLGRYALQGLLSEKPGRISELREAGYREAFATCLALCPEAASRSDKKYFQEMLFDPTYRLPPVARAFYLGQMRPALPHVNTGIEWHDPVGGKHPSDVPTVTHTGLALGLQPADAIYKSLGGGSSSGSSGTNIFGNHWHAGMVVSFGPVLSSPVFSLDGVHVSALSSCVHSFSSSLPFQSRTLVLADAMQTMKDKFVREFGCSSSEPFKGARSTSGLDYYTRAKIVNTALAMIGLDIGYTFVDQLDYCWAGWDGTIEDIDELRCDGLVEYSYEKNGIKVCEGKDADEWKISTPGKNHPENHNDFHSLKGCASAGWKKGQLCPRIQAGDVGHDSKFVIPAPAMPEITEYEVGTWPSLGVATIAFDVNAEFSRYAYVRILVRKWGNAEFMFLKSEDPLGLGEAGGGFPDGVWALRQLNIRKWRQGVIICWRGKTVDVPSVRMDLFGNTVELASEVAGPDFYDVDGKYEFRVQCIDQGGNVSDELSLWLDLSWQG